MTTVINNPGGSSDSSGSGAGIVIGVLVAIIVILLAWRYGVPALRGEHAGSTTNINVSIPAVTGGGNTNAPAQ